MENAEIFDFLIDILLMADEIPPYKRIVLVYFVIS